jgi:hypothetical protein
MSKTRKGSNFVGKGSPSPSKAGKLEMLQSDPMMDMFNNLNAKMDKMDVSFQFLCTEVSEMRVEIKAIKEVEKSLEFTQNLIQDNKKDLAELKEVSDQNKQKQAETTQKLIAYKQEKDMLLGKLLKLDMYIRRENLKFSGIAEDDNEQNNVTHSKLREKFANKLKISEGQNRISTMP